MIQVGNKEFLSTIFGEEWEKSHVTAFAQDPEKIPADERMVAWGGGSAKQKLKTFSKDQNQYFTISLFNLADDGKSRRRKALFDANFVIVVDDVKEKIPEANAALLPGPSYKMLSSEHSEQWGYILSDAEDNADTVNNLLEGLVKQGLAPDGKDPGMVGLTRYVRLPEGSNTKAKRYVDGKPFKCQMSEWHPERLHKIEDLADAFGIDLNAVRNESTSVSVSGDSPIYSKHPLWSHVNITGRNGDWTQIDCPNAKAHSSDDASGAAIMVRENGSLGFQCHHGSCNGDKDTPKVTGMDILKILDIEKEVAEYVHGVSVEGNTALAETLGMQIQQTKTTNNLQIVPRDDDNFNILRYIFIPNEDQFYDICTKEMITGEAMNRLYLRTMPGGKNMPEKASIFFHKTRNAQFCVADGVGWVPFCIQKQDRESVIIDFGNKRLVNSWSGLAIEPVEGDISMWSDHIKYLIPDESQRDTVIKYLAFTLQRPDVKIAYTILHRGAQGVGKDLMLVPVMRGLGVDSVGSIKVSDAVDGWGDHLARKKFLIIEEVDKAQNRTVNNALKTLLAPTATGVKTLNIKGGQVITQLDCLNTYMMSNRRNPISLEKDERRYFVVDSWIEKKEPGYYNALDSWIKNGGSAKVVDYLLNLDISDFQHNAPPSITEGMIEMQENGKYDYEMAIEELINEMKSPFQMPIFTLTTLKSELKQHDVKAITNSIVEAVCDNGYVCIRGTSRVDNKIKNSPKFFVLSDNPIVNASKSEIYDYFMDYKSGKNI